jgi:hypothetical protein
MKGFVWGVASMAVVAFLFFFFFLRSTPQPSVAGQAAPVATATAPRTVTTPPATQAAEQRVALPPNHRSLEMFDQPATQKAAPVDSPIHITLEASAKGGGVVYVIARGAGQSSGHPIAVKRVSTDSFPITVDFGAADAMMGQPFPSIVNLEARLDADGDAGTHNAAEPKASAAGVAAGSSLTLTLK